MSIELPAPLKVVEVRMEDGAIIRIRQHGNPAGPRLALSHGNGLAIDGYFPFWDLLRARYELILFDFRNHGQNPLHSFAHHDWQHFISDLERIWRVIAAEYGAKRIAGVFHSLSAVTSAVHTQRMGLRWDPLVLFDPPFYPRDGHPLQDVQSGNEDNIAARADRRPERYADVSGLAAQFARRFTLWQPGAHELMARATLRRDPEAGDWILACPREYEAHVFRSNRDTSAWTNLAHMPVAVKLICADPQVGDTPSKIGKAISEEMPVEYEAIPHSTHFLQIEQPTECIGLMEAFLVKHGMAA
ncbi:MAG: alpha/beta fold hydrolase [Candidatus Binataceae bacterium]